MYARSRAVCMSGGELTQAGNRLPPHISSDNIFTRASHLTALITGVSKISARPNLQEYATNATNAIISTKATKHQHKHQHQLICSSADFLSS